MTRHERRGRRELAVLQTAGWNVDEIPVEPGPQWRVDNQLQELPSEPPGEPVDGGPWQTAVRLLLDYEFVDPSVIRAVYDHELPLRERTMALHGRFLTLDFWMGVRVTRVLDEVRTIDDRAVRVNGYSYRTLERHLETGEITFLIRKWLDTGDVDFTMHSVSRTSHIPNPIIRLGFRLFGRRVQLRFARTAKERMVRLVEAGLQGTDGAVAPADVQPTVVP